MWIVVNSMKMRVCKGVRVIYHSLEGIVLYGNMDWMVSLMHYIYQGRREKIRHLRMHPNPVQPPKGPIQLPNLQPNEFCS